MAKGEQTFDAHPDTPVFVLRITAEGAAFYDDEDNYDARPELARILRAIADRMDAGDAFSLFESIRDVNGNECGSAALKRAGYWTDRDQWPRA